MTDAVAGKGKMGNASKGNGAWHAVQPGDTLGSIAGQYGCSEGDIREHPFNEPLKSRRGDLGALGRGDALFVPRTQQSAPQGPGPVGSGKHLVKDGECISCIAKETGHFWETIWDDPGNAEVKEARKDPNVLLKNDRVHIPELRPKEEPGQTEMRHRFKRKGEPSLFRLRLMDGQEPRANQPYTLEIDGQTFEGVTDAEGKLEARIPGNAKGGRLIVGPDGDQDEFPIRLGDVDPITELCGVQARLNNLGFGCGPTDGILGPQTKAALLRFQEQNNLPKTGQPDEATKAKLVEQHGS